MTKINPLYDNFVYLDKESHRYFDGEGNEYCGFSKFYSFLMKSSFNTELIASKVASRDDVQVSDVLAEWDRKTEQGNYYDKALEECVDPINYEKYPDIADEVRAVLSHYDGYYLTLEQSVCYNKYYRLAGSPDKMMITSARKDSMFAMSDFKCFEKGEEDLYKNRGWLKEPVAHLPASKFTKICFQLSYYAFQVELLTGKKCRELFIHLIDPIKKTNKKIYVPYLKTDIQMCLELYRNDILSKLANAGEDIF